MSVTSASVETFVKLGGYEIVKQIKRGKRKGQWKNVSEASRRTGLSRPTIYAILELHPEKPSKTKAKYVDKLEESEGYRRLKLMYEKTISPSAWTGTVSTVRQAFKLLGYNKDPMSWTEEDYRKLWAAEEFYKAECRGIAKRHGVNLRRLMRATDNHNLLAKFKFNSPPEGKKKQWFLHSHEIKKLLAAFEDIDALLFFFTGMSSGARSSAVELIKGGDLDTTDNVLQVYEEKVRHHVLKFPPAALVKVLETYINDFDIGAKQKLFPNSYSYYTERLKKAGEKAGIKKTVTTHIMKHTFVTQANRHGCSAETIVHQTGTELRVLEKFYRATNEAKLRHEMQGTAYEFVPFHDWIAELSYHVRARYNQLRAGQ
jgi:hypothetical protein